MDSYSDDDDDDDEFGEEEPSRARELLANFYGKLSESGSGKEESENTLNEDGYNQDKKSKKSEEKNAIDREAFDADAYVREMLERQKLEALLSADDSLCREIKTLSGDMQALVYENYSRFISATDTIRDMKQNVGALEDEMKSLTATMTEIDATSKAVNFSLADKRSQIDKLVRARRLLKRLEFLFELPRRLSAAALNKNYEEAVRYYAMTEEILHRYERVPSLGEIHKECARIADKLRTTLTASLQVKDDPSFEPEYPKDLSARVELLLRLGAQPATTERAAYISAFAHLNWLLQSASKKEMHSPPRFAASVASAVAPVFVVIADSLDQVSAVVDRVLSSRSGEKEDQNENETKKERNEDERPSIDEFALLLFGDYLDTVERSLDVTVATERTSLKSTASSTFYQDARRALEVAGDCIETAAAKCGVADLLRIKLQRLGRRAAARRLDDLASAAKLSAATCIMDLIKKEKQNDTIEKTLRQSCLNTATRLAAIGESALERASPLFEFLDDVDIEDAAVEYLRFVLKFIAAAGNITITESHIDQDQRILDPLPSAESLLTQAANGWLTVPPVSQSHLDSSRPLLLLGALLRELPDACKKPDLLTHSLKDYDEHTVEGDNSVAQDSIDQCRPSTASPPQRLRLADVVQSDEFQNASSLLFARYSRLSSAVSLAELPCGLCELALASGTGEVPTPELQQVLKSIHDVAALLATALGEESYLPHLNVSTIAPRLSSSDDFGLSSNARLGASSAHRVGGIELDVERLFASQGESSNDDALNKWTYLSLQADWSARSTAAALLKLLATTLLEEVRTMTLSTTAHYAQLDLDARYILAASDTFLRSPTASMDAAKDIERLLADFLQSASERALHASSSNGASRS